MTAIRDILGDSTATWDRRPPATESAIQVLVANCDFELPEEYLTILRYSNGGEGPLCIEPWYFRICSAEEVVTFNRSYDVDKYLPGYFVIGSDGGDDLLAIRKRDRPPFPVYMVPSYMLSEGDVVQIAYDFEMFAMAFGHEPTESDGNE